MPPDPARRSRKLGDKSNNKGARVLLSLLDQFCVYQLRQRGKAPGGVETYRWMLQRFVAFLLAHKRRPPRVTDLTPTSIQAWTDDMATAGLANSTLRLRQAAVSSFCRWLVRRQLLPANPVAALERPPHKRQPPAQVPGPVIMDRLVRAALQHGRTRDIALFLILRYTGMRRGSAVSLRVRHLDWSWGLRNVPTKGGQTQDIPLPSAAMRFLKTYIHGSLIAELGAITSETPLFWSTWRRRRVGTVQVPMTGRAVWGLIKLYGEKIGYPTLKPHDLRHGVALEVLEQHHNLEQVRALLGHSRIETTQIYTMIRPQQLKRAVAFYEESAERLLR